MPGLHVPGERRDGYELIGSDRGSPSASRTCSPAMAQCRHAIRLAVRWSLLTPYAAWLTRLPGAARPDGTVVAIAMIGMLVTARATGNTTLPSSCQQEFDGDAARGPSEIAAVPAQQSNSLRPASLSDRVEVSRATREIGLGTGSNTNAEVGAIVPPRHGCRCRSHCRPSSRCRRAGARHRRWATVASSTARAR